MAKKSRPPKTGAQAAAKWLAAMQGTSAQQNYTKGTNGKGQQAMQNAATAEALQSYSAGCQQSVTNGSRAKSLNNPMSAQLYNANTGQKGAAQLGVGAAKKQPKYQAAIDALQGTYGLMRETAYQLDPSRSRATAGARAAAALAVLMAAGKKGGGGTP